MKFQLSSGETFETIKEVSLGKLLLELSTMERSIHTLNMRIRSFDKDYYGIEKPKSTRGYKAQLKRCKSHRFKIHRELKLRESCERSQSELLEERKALSLDAQLVALSVTEEKSVRRTVRCKLRNIRLKLLENKWHLRSTEEEEPIRTRSVRFIGEEVIASADQL